MKSRCGKHIILISYIYSIMKTYHDTETGILYVKSDPAGTVEITSFDLRQELHDFFLFFRMNGAAYTGMTIEEFVDAYLKQK